MPVQPLSASLSPSASMKRNLVFRLRARLTLFNTHMVVAGRFLRIMRGPDQLIRSEPDATLTLLAPDTIESELPDNRTRLVQIRNQTALVSYDLAHNVREVSKSYYD